MRCEPLGPGKGAGECKRWKLVFRVYGFWDLKIFYVYAYIYIYLYIQGASVGILRSLKS